MLRIQYHSQFKRDYKLAMKRGLNIKLLQEVIEMLANEIPLAPKYRDHALVDSRSYKNMRECHIQPDWLLVYQVEQEALTLWLARTGSHSDLF